MREWLIGIALAATLTAVTDILLPKGGTSKYARLCISLMLTVVIIKPLISAYNTGFRFELPRQLSEEGYDIDDIRLVDNEFSERLTELLMSKTGLTDIKTDVKLGYDRIEKITVIGAKDEDKQTITSFLCQECGVEAECISYEYN